MNPTPRPWHYKDHVIRSVSGQNVSGLVPNRMSAADLQLIVTAVNSYDAMREALNLACDTMRGMSDYFENGLERAMLNRAIDQSKAALLLADTMTIEVP